MSTTANSKNTSLVKNKARELGFDFVGISASGFLKDDALALEKWLKNDLHGKMTYMENHFDKRVDTTKLVEGSRSVISLMYNYYTDETARDVNAPKISKYAYGKDYHFVIKDKLKELLAFMLREIGQLEARIFVDSAPVLERTWAKKSGLGWIGKNANLINKNSGSFFFLAEIIVDLELDYDGPVKDYCGSCTKCIDACPTEAILPNNVIDANKCISYLTIELKDEILPSEFEGKMQNWAFGCDICQDVCPWNRFSQKHAENAFMPHENLLNLNRKDWEEISEEIFRSIFQKSAVKRTKYKGLKRNIRFLNSSAQKLP